LRVWLDGTCSCSSQYWTSCRSITHTDS
jgi:hypothetical protein